MKKGRCGYKALDGGCCVGGCWDRFDAGKYSFNKTTHGWLKSQKIQVNSTHEKALILKKIHFFRLRFFFWQSEFEIGIYKIFLTYATF